jgi:hypothetical protein
MMNIDTRFDKAFRARHACLLEAMTTARFGREIIRLEEKYPEKCRACMRDLLIELCNLIIRALCRLYLPPENVIRPRK